MYLQVNIKWGHFRHKDFVKKAFSRGGYSRNTGHSISVLHTCTISDVMVKDSAITLMSQVSSLEVFVCDIIITRMKYWKGVSLRDFHHE